MGIDRLAKNVSIPVLLAAITLLPGSVTAGGQSPPGKNMSDASAGYSVPFDASAGYSAPMAAAYAFPGGIVDPTCPTCSYTVPIVLVYQCPAAMRAQRGSQVIYLRADSAYGLLGGRPYLYHR